MHISRTLLLLTMLFIVTLHASALPPSANAWKSLPNSAQASIRAAIAHDFPAARWQQLAELTPTSRQNNDWFGISVGVSGSTVVVGAFDSSIEKFGAAYVFVKPASGWQNMTQTAKLTSSDSGKGFGISVAIDGDTIVVGAANPSNFAAPAASPGAAYDRLYCISCSSRLCSSTGRFTSNLILPVSSIEK